VLPRQPRPRTAMRALTGLGLNRSDRVHKKNPVLNSNGACLTTSNETTTFFHPDYTVGSSVTGSAIVGSRAGRLTPPHRRSGIGPWWGASPCPEGCSLVCADAIIDRHAGGVKAGRGPLKPTFDTPLPMM